MPTPQKFHDYNLYFIRTKSAVNLINYKNVSTKADAKTLNLIVLPPVIDFDNYKLGDKNRAFFLLQSSPTA
ncbi:hypothetical protein NWP26_06970 [Chrysosporum ovalisporum APH033B]|uniref:hypothetical protein n=1 Tax=Umezakia ovalisporum TaxID=75695 RepID=UPI0024744BAD|nr:hypothetical protein [Umezakia ovalisporum]MDH6067001.1 hypothetical protein [Umezakia ovalisporum APH033B]